MSTAIIVLATLTYHYNHHTSFIRRTQHQPFRCGQVKRYIDRQKEHHRKEGYEEELIRFLEKYGMPRVRRLSGDDWHGSKRGWSPQAVRR